MAMEPHRSLEHQIDELREQVARVARYAASHGADFDDIRSGAAGAASGIVHSAQDAATRVRREATDVAKAAQEHPVTAATLFAGVAAAGFALGFLVAVNAIHERDRRWF
jgi:ElaB/YqjD/DUF883 family membrane-anchored ribosome-binding protein